MTLPLDMVVTIADARKAGYCALGVRRWFNENGGDFNAFLQDGMTVEDLLSLNDDGLVRRVAELKMTREGIDG